MSKASAILVLMAGIGMAAYALPHRDSEQHMAAVPRVGLDAPGADTRAQATEPRVVLPMQQPPADGYPAAEKGAGASTTVTTMLPTAGSAPASKARDVPAKAGGASGTEKLSDDEARRVLARDLQRELKRVGCYDGEISGIWNAQTRKAMAAFVTRINATLPVEQPDYILLTLLQGHSATACGPECGTGQVPGPNGTCVASNLITAALAAHAARSGTGAVEGAKSEGVKSAAKRKVSTRQVAAATPETSSWQTSVTAAPAAASSPDLSPPVIAPTQRQSVAAAPPAPLPGRMAAGITIGNDAVIPKGSVTVERAPIGPRVRDESVATAKAQPAETQGVGEKKSPVKPKVAAVAPPQPVAASDDDGEEEARRRRQARAAAQREEARREEARREEARERARRVATRPPGIVYLRPPAPVYAAPPPRVYRPLPPQYSANARNWKHAIFNDMSRMR